MLLNNFLCFSKSLRFKNIVINLANGSCPLTQTSILHLGCTGIALMQLRCTFLEWNKLYPLCTFKLGIQMSSFIVSPTLPCIILNDMTMFKWLYLKVKLPHENPFVIFS